MKNLNRIAFVLAGSCALAAMSLLAGCGDDTHVQNVLKDNGGSTLTTTPGQQITEAMLLGKWDLDGERTNTANGSGGVDAIPSDIVKDILGKGWKFESGGVLKTDQAVGWTKGTWKVDGADTLVIQEGGQATPQKYQTSFKDGFLNLTKADGKHLVFEKDKFFGF